MYIAQALDKYDERLTSFSTMNFIDSNRNPHSQVKCISKLEMS